MAAGNRRYKMTFPYSPGHPDYSSTGAAKFIPY
jgi:hypothetical protein